MISRALDSSDSLTLNKGRSALTKFTRSKSFALSTEPGNTYAAAPLHTLGPNLGRYRDPCHSLSGAESVGCVTGVVLVHPEPVGLVMGCILRLVLVELVGCGIAPVGGCSH